MLVQQVLICEGNKPQIQSNHVIIRLKNLFFLLKAGPGLKYKFTITLLNSGLRPQKIAVILKICVGFQGAAPYPAG